MLSIEDNEVLTRTDRGTPMGDLIRRYWNPVCAVDELLRSPFRTKEVRIMGEELVVYMDRSGQLGIVDKYCTHRRASLAYGVVEEHGIRCQYHGWKFDETGSCIEQPFEDTTHPEDNFRSKCGTTSYRAEALGGLVFAYMGPEPAPLLPRWSPLVWEDAVRDICIVELPCNWLQCQENSLDPVHTEHLHGNAGAYFKQVIYRKEEPTFRPRPRHQKIGFDTFEYGIIKRRVTENTTEDDDGWKVGHPILFPNILFQGSPMHVKMQFRVPMDDTHCLHISLYTWRAAPGAVFDKQDVVPSRIVPLYEPGTDKFILNFQFNQDYMAWVTQGPIAKRHLEKLGESDRGIIMFRRMLLDQVERLRDGAEPSVNIFRDPVANECLNIMTEIGNFSGEAVGSNGRRTEDLRGYVPEEAGYSADADKIVEVLKTWEPLTANEVREFVGVV